MNTNETWWCGFLTGTTVAFFWMYLAAVLAILVGRCMRTGGGNE